MPSARTNRVPIACRATPAVPPLPGSAHSTARRPPAARPPYCRAMDVRTTPKVELHRHLEGSYRVATVFELSKAHGLPLPADTLEGFAAHVLVRAPVADL